MRLKKSVKRILLIALILILVGTGLIVYQSITKKEVKKVKIVNKIDDYGYSLKSNKSKKYKELFEELKEILNKEEVDEEKYVEQISKMFILDFYTLSDKLTNTDVGGLDFVYSTAKTPFLEKAEDTIYKYVESNLYDNRNQELPTVDEITINSIEQIEYTVGTDYIDSNAYQVNVTWTYKENLDYQNEATLIFAHEDKKLSLVEME